ncbi:5-formyltetrahydrofolate cyclo-ligase [Tautonia plasticadhaerens]|uniref:5-formyltetrahydrofolate cyclo-ligase n=1 Tax=Tautonia plasticadhaerens TaxID=2527974 RepID=A0A518H869_9BACT|nr:5-formyltetrahydrofolate cyclo-ligase [Tautonia plasticadhaerens]QDV37034.1 putative 5-formyltetrahydrofolate cyclo-ligase [Tautonia plasticadhaerens]
MSNADPARGAKRRLRREVVGRILAMDPTDRRREEEALGRLFPGLPGLDSAEVLLLYLAHLPEEFETRGMVQWAREQGKAVACPRVDREARLLRLHLVEDLERDLEPGPFGIPEPSPGTSVVEPGAVDWALVPGIAFDPRGYRIGRGAGYYDRLLPTLRPEAPRYSLVLDLQWIDQVPDEPHDQRVDGVVGVARRSLLPRGPR